MIDLQSRDSLAVAMVVSAAAAAHADDAVDPLVQDPRGIGSSEESPQQIASHIVTGIISQLFASKHINSVAANGALGAAADAAAAHLAPTVDQEFDVLLAATDRRQGSSFPS